jgi:predicted amidophosphoribosyltransferase
MPTREGAMKRGNPHSIQCPYCAHRFDLFSARWCPHLREPSKICPNCARCLCEHPAYRNPHYWSDAPLGFRRRGFQRLFLFYV